MVDRIDRMFDVLEVDGRGLRLEDGPEYVLKEGDRLFVCYCDVMQDWGADDVSIDSYVCSDEELRSRLKYHVDNGLSVHEVKTPGKSVVDGDRSRILDCEVLAEL